MALHQDLASDDAPHRCDRNPSQKYNPLSISVESGGCRGLVQPTFIRHAGHDG
jgi:hypothetical protein